MKTGFRLFAAALGFFLLLRPLLAASSVAGISAVTGAGADNVDFQVADLNADAQPDIVLARPGPELRILQNVIPTSCLTPPSGLVAWWRGENDALDALGTNHASLINGAGFTAGQVGAAFQFDGVDDYVSVPHGPVWDFGMADFTIEFWAKLDQIKDSMFLHQQAGGGAGGFELFTRSEGGLYFALNSVEVADSGNWSSQAGAWYHLAVTRSNHFFRLFVNGVQIPNSGHVNTNPVANVTGAVRLGSYAAGGFDMAGALDEVSVHHRALPPTELAAIAQAGSAGRCPFPPHAPILLVDDAYAGTQSLSVTGAATIRFSGGFPGGSIFYSLDGSDPRLGLYYADPFPLTRSAAIRAVAVDAAGGAAVEMSPVNVTVLGPPVFLAQPGDREARAGEAVEFAVNVGGIVGPLAVVWFRVGNALPIAIGPALQIPAVQPADAGALFAVATNDFGAVTGRVANLIVFVPPGVAQGPASTNAFPGDTVTFCVMGTGDPPLQFQWRHNGSGIRGATNACLTFTNVQLSDGGTYTVVINNASGSRLSDPAELVVAVPLVQPGDNFTNRVEIFGAAGSVGGTNSLATREPGEPMPVDKFGTHSVWYRWRAPGTGIVTFRTLGSSFDTLLGVYNGTNVTELTPLVSDEDRGGFLTSEVQLNVQSNAVYNIAVDGVGGQSGNFVLSWNLLFTPEVVPVITAHPASATVAEGGTHTFAVAASSANGAPLTYQWHFFGMALSNATGPTFTVSNVQPANVGAYNVRVSNGPRLADSRLAFLEIGPAGTPVTFDKLEDLFQAAARGGGGGVGPEDPRPAPGAVPVTPVFVPVTIGTVETRWLDNRTNGAAPFEPPPCGALAAHSVYYGFEAQADGVFTVDTSGSTVDTSVAISRAPPLSEYFANPSTYTALAQALPLACDNNSGTDGRGAFVAFFARQGSNYLVQVDGATAADIGLIRFRYSLTNSNNTVVSQKQIYRIGDRIELRTDPPLGGGHVQWMRDDAILPGATNTAYTLNSLTFGQGGTYEVAVTNGTAITRKIIARIVVATLQHSISRTPSQTQLRLVVRGSEPVNLDLATRVPFGTAFTPRRVNVSAGSTRTVTNNIPFSATTNGYYRLRISP